MQSASHELFASSRRSRHQHRAEMRSDPSYPCVDLQHERTASNDAFELICIEEFLIETQGFFPRFSLVHQCGNPAPEFVDFNRLRQIVASTLLNLLYSGF